jgi:hypothetical protein
VGAHVTGKNQGTSWVTTKVDAHVTGNTTTKVGARVTDNITTKVGAHVTGNNQGGRTRHTKKYDWDLKTMPQHQ